MKTFEDRQYQANAIEENLNYLETKEGNLCCCMPGGSGKAYVIARMAQILAKQGKRVLMLVNNGKLVKQNTETLQAIWPNAPLGVYASQLKRRELDCKITYAMIQSINRHASTLGHIDVILVDEAHAINNKQQGTYRKFISDLTEINPAIKIQGYSASPYRLGQGMVTDGDDALFTDISEPVTIKELLEMGFLSPLRSPETSIQLNTEGLKKTAGEFSLSDMQNRFNTDEANKEIALHMKENRSDRNHWLIFCSGIEHCENFARALNDIGITAESLTQKNNNKQDEILERFESGKTRALCNFGILTTGYDFPALDYIALIRKTNSPGLYCLDMNTEVLTDSGFKKYEEIDLKNDLICSVSQKDMSPSFNKALGSIKKLTKKEEGFVRLKNDHVDFRVTGNHDVLISKKKFNGDFSPLRKVKAHTLHDQCKFYIPVAYNNNRKDIDAMDCELQLLGLLITDGTLNKISNAITITQSERHQFVIDYINRVLNSCGLKFTKSKIREKGHKTNIGVCKYASYRWTISKGKPRGRDKDKIGWGSLPWFSLNAGKKIPHDIKHKVSKRQFMIFAEALHMGYGVKNFKTGYKICCGNIELANDLQFAAINNGLSSNMLKGSNSVKLVTIHDKGFRSVTTKAKDRKKAFQKQEIEEQSWCLETVNKTLVIRHNGRVSITGNCQIIVRGMRIFEGKENCFIDDFCGNIEQHGPVIAIQPPPPPGKRKKQKAPIKTCPTCSEMLPASVMLCYHCGHRFEANQKHYELSTADVLGLRPNVMDVTGWRWSHHISRSSGKEMIKCIYYGSLSQKPITEYFTVTHEGKAGQVAVGKIQQIAANSNDLDLNQAQNLYELSDLLNRRSTPPAQIKYSKNGKIFSVDKRIWA